MKNMLPQNSIIADSGFWVALANRIDRHHQVACDAFARYEHLIFVVTWPVITEACHLIYSRINLRAQFDCRESDNHQTLSLAKTVTPPEAQQAFFPIKNQPAPVFSRV